MSVTCPEFQMEDPVRVKADGRVGIINNIHESEPRGRTINVTFQVNPQRQELDNFRPDELELISD